MKREFNDFADLRQAVTDLGQETLTWLSSADAPPPPDSTANPGTWDLDGINKGLERLRNGRFQVAFVGQMKAGKSTLVNALLFGREVLPSAATPQTAKLTCIRHAEQESVRVEFYRREEWEELEQKCHEEKGFSIVADGAKDIVVEGAKDFAETVKVKVLAAAGQAIGQAMWNKINNKPSPDTTDHGVECSKGDEPPASDEAETKAFSYCRLVKDARDQVGWNLDRLLGTDKAIALADLKDYVAAFNPENKQGRYTAITRKVQIEAPLNGWPAHIDFIDTPGTNDPDLVRERVTTEYLAQADAVVLVLYAGRPGDRQDVEFLSKALLPVGLSKLLLVMNKIDNVPAKERAEVQAYQHEVMARLIEGMVADGACVPPGLREMLERPEGISLVSSLAALVARSNGTGVTQFNWYWKQMQSKLGVSELPEAEKCSGVLEFEKRLRDFLFENKGQRLLEPPVNKLAALLGQVESSLKDRRRALETRRNAHDLSAEELDRRIRTKEGETRRRRADIELLIAKVRADFDRRLYAHVDQQLLGTLDEGVKDIRNLLEEEVGKIGSRGKPHDLNRNISWRWKDIVGSIEREHEAFQQKEGGSGGIHQDVVALQLEKLDFGEEGIRAIAQLMDRRFDATEQVPVRSPSPAVQLTAWRKRNKHTEARNQIYEWITKRESEIKQAVKQWQATVSGQVQTWLQGFVEVIQGGIEAELNELRDQRASLGRDISNHHRDLEAQIERLERQGQKCTALQRRARDLLAQVRSD